MVNFETIDNELAKHGFTPGCLVKTKQTKTFWEEYGTPVMDQLTFDNGDIKQWIRGEKYVRIENGTILMFLGNLRREVDMLNSYDYQSKQKSSNEHRLLCFLYKQKIIWWDFLSIEGGVGAFIEKFEVLNSGVE